jgi:hypothetical protein
LGVCLFVLLLLLLLLLFFFFFFFSSIFTVPQSKLNLLNFKSYSTVLHQ